MSNMTGDMASELRALTEKANHQLDRELLRKGEVGAQKYGEWAFLQNATLDMAMDEIVDLMNYARFTYNKLYIMNEMLKARAQEPNIVQEGFVPTSALFGDQ